MKKKKTTPRPPGFVITGINSLTGERETISQVMTYESAIKIMDRERGKTRSAWLCLKAISQEMTHESAIKIMDRERGKTRSSWLRLKAERKTPRKFIIKIEEI